MLSHRHSLCLMLFWIFNRILIILRHTKIIIRIDENTRLRVHSASVLSRIRSTHIRNGTSNFGFFLFIEILSNNDFLILLHFEVSFIFTHSYISNYHFIINRMQVLFKYLFAHFYGIFQSF